MPEILKKKSNTWTPCKKFMKWENKMHIQHNHLTIRNATPDDAELLCRWWNDGKIMAHAGFPKGLNETPENLRQSLTKDSDTTHRRHIIEHNNTPIGEMNYRNKGNNIAEIGIKICDFSHREKGLGTTLLKLFINALFTELGYQKIVLDTDVNNKRARHVYEHKLGFTCVGIREKAFRDQLGEWRSAVDYELTAEKATADTIIIRKMEQKDIEGGLFFA